MIGKLGKGFTITNISEGSSLVRVVLQGKLFMRAKSVVNLVDECSKLTNEIENELKSPNSVKYPGGKLKLTLVKGDITLVALSSELFGLAADPDKTEITFKRDNIICSIECFAKSKPGKQIKFYNSKSIFVI